MLLTTFGDRFTLVGGEGPIIMFLATATVVLTLPLLLAGSDAPAGDSRSAPGTRADCGSDLLGVPANGAINGGAVPRGLDLAAINAVSAFVVLIIVVIVRVNGYSLMPTRSAATK